MLRFALRDDDTSFFTRPAELAAVYGDIWDRVPVSLAVVPFQSASSEERIPKNFRNLKELFPLAQNSELVNFLKEGQVRGQLAVMQHGYSHGDDRVFCEFRDGRDLGRKAREGRRYLEKLLGVGIKAFVPPKNSFSRQGFEAVVDAGLNIVGIPSFRPQVRRIRWADLLPYARYKSFFLSRRHQGYSYPWPLQLSDHGEVSCYGLVPEVTLTQLKRGVDFAHALDGVFCLATHYWEVLQDAELRQILAQIVDYALSIPGVRPVSVPRLFE